MRVIAWKRLRLFAEHHPRALKPLKLWARAMEAATFETPAHVKRAFGTSVSFLSNGIVIFDLGGNKYRVSVNIRYHLGRVYVRRVMTHDEYDRLSRSGDL